MMAATIVVSALLFVACSYALPLRTARMYGSPLLVVPVLVQELEDPQALINEESMYALNDGSKVADGSFNIEKRSTEEADDDDLETAAGSNVLRPLFVYRQQVAYRKRVRDAIRRGRRI
ncbi:PREDICTED: uncharacterized protein LOC105569285 [Vollenhovia emeryi]|uniref:uncharacterized protein LOC105569285 n=1 Tax=Vollenhovia emeryi TaxID=411798 RepID=UPI0005F36155|nr:PREDICTED: uncharacterized protein LOC105569285 [Vollenhovia emeryi]